MEVDVDDTAKALLTLSLLGQPAPHVGLLKTFEGETHFKTYQHERNPSLSANCNVLMALLHQPEVATLTPQIIKAASFIRKAWWNGALYDKWVGVIPRFPRGTS
jgi:aphidicolan-16beta-ol synthase/syn-copalyl-diphosphate synthase